jgi:hypothetical protein
MSTPIEDKEGQSDERGLLSAAGFDISPEKQEEIETLLAQDWSEVWDTLEDAGHEFERGEPTTVSSDSEPGEERGGRAEGARLALAGLMILEEARVRQEDELRRAFDRLATNPGFGPGNETGAELK